MMVKNLYPDYLVNSYLSVVFIHTPIMLVLLIINKNSKGGGRPSSPISVSCKFNCRNAIMDSSAQSAKETEGEGETSSTSSSGEKQKKKSLFSTSSFKSGFKVPSMKMPDLKVYLCLPTPTSSPDELADTCVHWPACIFTHRFCSCSQRSI